MPGPGVLFVTIGSTVGIEEHRLQPLEQASSVSPVRWETARPRWRRRWAAAANASGEHFKHELPRGEVVVGSGVEPEQLRVAADFRERRRLEPVGVREDRFEDVAHVQAVGVALVVVDVAAGQRRLVEMPDQDLLLERQRGESVGIELHDRGIVDPLEQILAATGHRGNTGRRRRRRVCCRRVGRFPGRPSQTHDSHSVDCSHPVNMRL